MTKDEIVNSLQKRDPLLANAGAPDKPCGALCRC